jgi:hypothetical protein
VSQNESECTCNNKRRCELKKVETIRQEEEEEAMINHWVIKRRGAGAGGRAVGKRHYLE